MNDIYFGIFLLHIARFLNILARSPFVLVCAVVGCIYLGIVLRSKKSTPAFVILSNFFVATALARATIFVVTQGQSLGLYIPMVALLVVYFVALTFGIKRLQARSMP